MIIIQSCGGIIQDICGADDVVSIDWDEFNEFSMDYCFGIIEEIKSIIDAGIVGEVNTKAHDILKEIKGDYPDVWEEFMNQETETT